MPLARLVASAAVTLIGVGVGACGSAHTGSVSSRPGSWLVATTRTSMGDGDGDSPGSGYHDSDDRPVTSYGHAGSEDDTRALRLLVERYYAAGAAADSVLGCELTHPLARKTLPKEFGRPPGPPYLRGANTCPSLLTRVFEHFHSQLTVPIEVTDARVSGDRAYALVASKTLPAGFMKARRVGGVWRIDGLLADPLP